MVATRRGVCILAIALATVAAGCGSHEPTRREAAVTACEDRVEASALYAALKDELRKGCAQDPSADGMTAQAQLTRRAVCRKIVLKRTTPGPARQRGLAACAVNSRYP